MTEQRTNIFLLRHGETTWNLEKRWQGSKNSDLTLLGIAQVEKAKVNLSYIKINHAFVSPSKRALDSMDILLSGQAIQAFVLNDLREITLGSWEGKTHEEVEKINSEQFYNFWNKPELFNLENAENYEELQHRVTTVLENLFNEYEGSNILVVSHGLSIKVAMAYYSKIPISNLSKMKDPLNAEVICISKDKNIISISS